MNQPAYQFDRTITRHVRDLAARGAIFYINHSGGKDSQAMTICLERIVPREQLAVIHADLPLVDWSGCWEHIEATTDLDKAEVVAGKTFWDMVEHRQMFPNPIYRQCTSDLKRGPIEKWIRADMKRRGATEAVSCMGLRIEESPKRKKMIEKVMDAGGIKKNTRLTITTRTIWDLFPIHDMTLAQVWATIDEAGQQPHWVYAEGMTRLSCMFCIMASTADLKTAARLVPDVYRRYVETEKRLQFHMNMDGYLEDLTGILADGTETTPTVTKRQEPEQLGLFC